MKKVIEFKLQTTIETKADRWGQKREYRPCYNETLIRKDDNGVTIEFTVKSTDSYLNSHLNGEHFNKKNLAKMTELVLTVLGHQSHAYRGDEGVLAALASEHGYGFEKTFVILYDQKGYGFMGGNGVGKNIHHLTYNKVTGVKPGLPTTIAQIADLWFKAMTNQALRTREENRHVKKAIAAEDIYVTFGAVPDCQSSVAGWSAKGYPIKAGTDKHLTCKNCLRNHK